MKIESKDFRVREGDKVNLEKWPTKVDPVYKSKDQYKSLLEEHVAKLARLQQLHYASNRHAILLILQATDAAGKDGAIRHVMSGVNPQGCRVYSFKQPTAAELEHDFLWRTTRDLPERGRIAIFNRSYYEEVLVVRVHRDILESEAIPDAPHHDKKVWRERYRSINDFERHLDVNGTRVVKVFLHLSKEEQRKRFLERIDDPQKNWKFSDADLKERKFWKDYAKAYEECLERDQHRRRAVVCRSRRRQGKRPADRLADPARHVRGSRHELSQDGREARARIAGVPGRADWLNVGASAELQGPRVVIPAASSGQTASGLLVGASFGWCRWLKICAT